MSVKFECDKQNATSERFPLFGSCSQASETKKTSSLQGKSNYNSFELPPHRSANTTTLRREEAEES